MDLREKFASFSTEDLEIAYEERTKQLACMSMMGNVAQVTEEVEIIAALLQERKNGAK